MGKEGNGLYGLTMISLNVKIISMKLKGQEAKCCKI